MIEFLVVKIIDSDNADIGTLVTSLGVVLAIIGFILFVFFAVVNPSVQPGATPIQIQKVFTSVEFIIFGFIFTYIGVFISKR
jgi:hypothetical protein